MNKRTRIQAVILIVIIVVLVLVVLHSRTQEAVPAQQPATGSNFSKVYTDSSGTFSIGYPTGYTVDPTFKDQVSSSRTISGVKFTIPASVSSGTNLGDDSYVSVETLPQNQACTGSIFLSQPSLAHNQTQHGISYSVASSTDAGAGNRYEEFAYALSGTNPCIAVKYFIHYGVIENYPPGTVKQFDEQALLNQFDQIRESLVVNE